MDPSSQKGTNVMYASSSPAAYTSSAIPKLRRSICVLAPSWSALRHRLAASCFLQAPAHVQEPFPYPFQATGVILPLWAYRPFYVGRQQVQQLCYRP